MEQGAVSNVMDRFDDAPVIEELQEELPEIVNRECERMLGEIKDELEITTTEHRASLADAAAAATASIEETANQCCERMAMPCKGDAPPSVNSTLRQPMTVKDTDTGLTF